MIKKNYIPTINISSLLKFDFNSKSAKNTIDLQISGLFEIIE